MTTVPGPTRQATDAPDLNSGDRMTRAQFHRLYSQMPDHFKAELVEGIVYVASPLKIRHGKPHIALAALFGTYEAHTPGVETADNVTVLLGDESEPQPDLYMRILPEFGGQSRTSADDYIDGPPELIAEIAYATYSVDLHAKRRDYRRHGVLEYLVVNVKDQRLVWLDLSADKEIAIGGDGIARLRAFPGLWVDSAALFDRNYGRLMSTLQQGLTSPEHAEFVRKLAAAGAGKAAS